MLNWLKKLFGGKTEEAPKQEAAPAVQEPAQEAENQEQPEEIK
jgi:hypothetical protein